MKKPSATAGEEQAKRNLDELLKGAAKELGSKIKDADDARAKARADGKGGSGLGGNDQVHGDKGVDIDEMLSAFDKKLRDAEMARLARLSSYGQIRKKHGRYIQEMVDELGNFFMRDNVPELRGHFKSGIYDLRRALQNDFRFKATGKRDPKVFLRRDDPTDRNVEAVFCVDISGSMNGQKIQAAKEALVVFLEALSELKIAHGALAFNNRPRVLKPLDKDADETAREAMLPLLQPSGGTDDFAALQAAAQMLHDSRAEQRIIFYLTDGQGNAKQKEAVKRLEEDERIKVIGIGVGPGCETVKSTYAHHLVVPDVSTLPRQLGEMMTDELMDT